MQYFNNKIKFRLTQLYALFYCHTNNTQVMKLCIIYFTLYKNRDKWCFVRISSGRPCGEPKIGMPREIRAGRFLGGFRTLARRAKDPRELLADSLANLSDRGIPL